MATALPLHGCGGYGLFWKDCALLTDGLTLSRYVIIEMDCANLIAKVLADSKDRSSTSARVSDIKEAMKGRVGRDCNKIAHNLAQLALETHIYLQSVFFLCPAVYSRTRCIMTGPAVSIRAMFRNKGGFLVAKKSHRNIKSSQSTERNESFTHIYLN
jgi:hypothetical protein